MSERKYTDEQIVKALECCINADCLNCPQWSEEWYSGMCNDFLKSVLDLINRQKVEIAVLTTAVDNSTKEFLKLHDEYQDQKKEIEKLQEVNADLNESLRLAAEANKDLKAEIEMLREDVLEVTAILGEIELRNAQIKAEAIRAFAERVINLIYSADDINPITEWQIDNLVAEMMEGE